MVERSDPNERYVIIEDTLEIQCRANNLVQLHTAETADMTRLVRTTMRLRPDRIIIGEVRGAEALALLKAWNTGHPGGVTTIHANSARAALTRLSSLVQEAGVPPQPELIAETINLIVFIVRMFRGTTGHGSCSRRRIQRARSDSRLTPMKLDEGIRSHHGLRFIRSTKEVREMKRLKKVKVRGGNGRRRLPMHRGSSHSLAASRRSRAVAAGGALPWDAPLTTLQNDLQGPVAHAITTAASSAPGSCGR